MKYLKIILTSLFLSLIVTNTYAAKGAATVYKIIMTKLEMCDSTSTDSSCKNPVTIGIGESAPIDIASTTAGASAASYGNLALGNLGTTYTYFQITMKRAFTVKGTAKDGAGTVLFRSAPSGTGIIAGGPIRAACEVVGIKDVVAKSLGSANPINVLRACIKALKSNKSPKTVAFMSPGPGPCKVLFLLTLAPASFLNVGTS